jgi:hypothetical protein
LAALRSHGKKLFLTSNKHLEFLELTMKETLGKNWQDFFDIIVANCRKPLFYKSENPFYEVRDSTQNWKGGKLKNASDITMNKGKVFLEGNARTLT